MRTLGTVALFTLLAGRAFAHPDHTSGSTAGLAHLVSDPFHLSLIVLAIGLVYGARRALRRAQR